MMHSTSHIANRNAGAVLLVGLALVACLFVAFIGVLQGAVQRGESFRQQLNVGINSGQGLAITAGDNGSNGTRFLSQRSVGAPIAPTAMFAVQGIR